MWRFKMEFDEFYKMIQENIEKEFSDNDLEKFKRWLKVSYHYGQDDGVMEAASDVKSIISAYLQIKSLDTPEKNAQREKRFDEMWNVMLNDPNPEGDITVGIKKGTLKIIGSGSKGYSTFEKEFPEKWAANKKMPLTRDQQIDMMLNSKQRHEKAVERIMKDTASFANKIMKDIDNECG